MESFFKNDEGHNVPVNGDDRYRAMITNFFIPELNNHDVQELRFQQDGATCHTAHTTIDFLKDTFGDRLISRFGPVNWPPRSCDLTPLDYFLWGYVKSLVYADKPQTLDHLEDNIRRVIADIRPQMLEKVIENSTSRLDYIRASRGTKSSALQAMTKRSNFQRRAEASASFVHVVLPTRGLLATDHVILNHGQVTWTTPELAPPLLTTTPHQREDVSALNRFSVHRCPTRRVFSGTGLEPVTKQATVRYLYHSSTAARKFPGVQVLMREAVELFCCEFMTGFTSTPKENKKLSLNTLLVFGLRFIGRGFTAGKKLLCTLNLPCISKNIFRAHELKLLEAVQLCSEENMKAASKEVQSF
ncbi:putative DD41D transposase [Trichonephila clavipes]|nr:putative DD41D transposase [Trichonephila clavipes]